MNEAVVKQAEMGGRDLLLTFFYSNEINPVEELSTSEAGSLASWISTLDPDQSTAVLEEIRRNMRELVPVLGNANQDHGYESIDLSPVNK